MKLLSLALLERYAWEDLEEEAALAGLRNLGKLRLMGPLVASDPWIYPHAEEAFVQELPKGEFPVSLYYVEDSRLVYQPCFLHLRFSDNKPTKWVMLHAADQDPKTLDKQGYFGFQVESGWASLSDLKTRTWYQKILAQVYAKHGKEVDLFNDYFQDIMLKQGHEEFIQLGLNEEGVARMLVFDVEGSGIYPCFLGLDEAGQAACLCCDFMAFDVVDLVERLQIWLLEAWQTMQAASPKLLGDLVAWLKAWAGSEVDASNFENTYPSFCDDLRYILDLYLQTSDSPLVLLGMNTELLALGQLDFSAWLRFFTEAVLSSLGAGSLALEGAGTSISDAQTGHISEILEEINQLTELIDQLSEHGHYSQAAAETARQIHLAQGIADLDGVFLSLDAMINNQAYYLYKAGALEQALDLVEEALMDFSYYDMLWHTFAEILAELGRHEAALEAIEQALSLTEDQAMEIERLDFKQRLAAELAKKTS